MALLPAASLLTACLAVASPKPASAQDASASEASAPEEASASAAEARVEEVAEPVSAREGGADAPPDVRPAFALVRWEEDWSRFVPPPTGGSPFDPLKRIALGRRDVFLSLGADLRARYEYFRQPDLGVRQRVDDFVLWRALVHGELRATAHARLFVQLGSLWMLGEAGEAGPLDEDRLDVQQAFVEASGALGAGELVLRVGRQEIALGSQRLLSIRKGPNLRRSFDAVRLGGRWPALRVDLLGAMAVRPAPGVFDDAPDPDEWLWGAYATLGRRSGGGPLTLDVYYLGLRREAAQEHRHSLGARLFGDVGPLDLNFEGLVQLGELGDERIRAWTVASDTGLTARFEEGSVRVGLRANATSGDRDPDDGHAGTFDALYPKLKYFSESGLLVPSNFVDLHPMVGARFLGATLTVGWDVFFRYSTRDTVYGPPGRPLLDAEVSDARRVGHTFVAELGVPLGRHLELTAYYTRFWVGPFLEAGGLRDVHFFGSWFEWTI